jgi:hypothetical protein
MPVSVASSGSQTATLATDHTVATLSAPANGGVYLWRVDTANLVNGETLILTLKTRARAADTTRQVYQGVFAHIQSDPIKDSPAIAIENGNELVAILRQEGGTGRAFPWSLKRLDG